MGILIKGGNVTDPGNITGRFDILIEGEKIAAISPYNTIRTDVHKVIRAEDKIIAPGLIDMHVHFRAPGQEHKETIETGCMAAANGGFFAVCAMPNTSPVNDNPGITSYMLEKAEKACGVKLYPAGAITRGLSGKELCDYDKLKQAGIIAITDDGMPVTNSFVMRCALQKAKKLDLPVIAHSEDMALSAIGAMNEGRISSKLGIAGIPNAAESIGVMRDIALCELTGARLHIAHVSTREAINAIRDAKNRGANLTCETAPHYFTLTDEYVEKAGTNAKMNPPLRSLKDVMAVRDALSDGTIDVIATDHAPHSRDEKNQEFEKAPNGIIGLETSFPISLKLVEDSILDMAGLIKKMAVNPGKILGIENRITIGNHANISILDIESPYIINPEDFKSLSRNTPFGGWNVKGRAAMVIADGKIIWDNFSGTR